MQNLFDKITYPFDSAYRIRAIAGSENQEIWHYHQEYELTLITGGNGRRYIGDNTEKFKNGDLVLLGKDLAHYWKINPSAATTDNAIIAVQFKESFFSSNFFEKPEMISIFQLIGRSKTGIAFYGRTKEEVSKHIKEIAGKNDFEKLLDLLKILKILSNSREYSLLSNPVFSFSEVLTDDSRIHFAYEHIKNNYKGKISLEDLCKPMNMSDSAFCRYFKRKTQKTFITCVIEYRIAQACKMLAESKNPVTEICFNCGYENIAMFNRHFKTLTHTSPLKYRHRFSRFR